MITLNGKKFARTEKEFKDSLFEKDGTAVGFYQPYTKSIVLMDHKRKRIGVINRYGVLCCATKKECGRYWYSLATIKEIGEFEDILKQYDDIQEAMKKCSIKLVYS